MPVALITGASRGLGLALARRLARDGWELIVDGRDEGALRAATQELDPRVTAIAGDVSDPDHRRRLIQAADRFATIDLLVNNASTLGVSPLPPLARYPLEELERVFRVNVLAPLALIQSLQPNLGPGSTIVNITSDAAVEPYEGWGGYGASKAALDQLSAVLGAEHPDLHVYSFDPGDMRTEMHQAAYPGEDISDRPQPETVVPAFMRLVEDAPPSGRYLAKDLALVQAAS